MKAKIWNKKWWVKGQEEKELVERLTNNLLNAGFKIVGECEKVFEPQGFTKLWLLAESHLALHTFPEEDKSYIELSSCNKEKYKIFCRLLKK